MSTLLTNDVRLWSLNAHRITFANVAISKGPGASGFPESNIFKVKPAGPGFKWKQGGDGSFVRYSTSNTVWLGTLRLMQTSPTNGILSAAFNADRLSDNGSGIGSFKVEDLQGASKFLSLKSFIDTDPEDPIDVEPGDIEWSFVFTQVAHLIGGN